MSFPDDAQVTYAFFDASVPPQFHRSWTLTVTREWARLVVTSYGDVLADRERGTPPQVWAALGQDWSLLKGLVPFSPLPPPVGGTGLRVTIAVEGGALLELLIDTPDGGNQQLLDRLSDWIRPARELFPPVDALAPPGS